MDGVDGWMGGWMDGWVDEWLEWIRFGASDRWLCPLDCQPASQPASLELELGSERKSRVESSR